MQVEYLTPINDDCRVKLFPDLEYAMEENCVERIEFSDCEDLLRFITELMADGGDITDLVAFLDGLFSSPMVKGKKNYTSWYTKLSGYTPRRQPRVSSDDQEINVTFVADDKTLEKFFGSHWSQLSDKEKDLVRAKPESYLGLGLGPLYGPSWRNGYDWEDKPGGGINFWELYTNVEISTWGPDFAITGKGDVTAAARTKMLAKLRPVTSPAEDPDALAKSITLRIYYVENPLSRKYVGKLSPDEGIKLDLRINSFLAADKLLKHAPVLDQNATVGEVADKLESAYQSSEALKSLANYLNVSRPGKIAYSFDDRTKALTKTVHSKATTSAQAISRDYRDVDGLIKGTITEVNPMAVSVLTGAHSKASARRLVDRHVESLRESDSASMAFTTFPKGYLSVLEDCFELRKDVEPGARELMIYIRTRNPHGLAPGDTVHVDTTSSTTWGYVGTPTGTPYGITGDFIVDHIDPGDVYGFYISISPGGPLPGTPVGSGGPFFVITDSDTTWESMGEEICISEVSASGIIEVYENDRLLTLGVDYAISLDNGSTWFSFLPVGSAFLDFYKKAKAGRFYVRLFNKNVESVYWIKYRVHRNQKLSSCNQIFLRNGRVVFDSELRNSSGTAQTILIARSNTTNPYLTSVIREYSLRVQEV
jgi:hypothetical protein